MERVLVVGAGAMGAGIALVAANAGYDVALVEPDDNARSRAQDRLRRDADRMGATDAVRRITFQSEIAATDAFLAVEVVTERLETKRAVFARLSEVLPRETLLATNTSSLSLEEIFDGITAPERTLGLHFFNPPTAMRLVEIVTRPETSQETVDAALAFVERCSKTAVLASDTPGFIVNRVARPYYLQAMRAFAEGIAQPEEIDRLARGVGFRMGPFALMDLIGLDVNLATSDSVYERTGEERFEPIALQREMVARGELGRKSGHGFYDYSAGVPPIDDTVETPPLDGAEAERIAVVGMGPFAEDFVAATTPIFSQTVAIENEEFFDEQVGEPTAIVDVGDGFTDRTRAILQWDHAFDAATVLFVDAYATDVEALARRMEHPERLVGYGVLGAFGGQRFIEIVDLDESSDDALALAEELFGAAGKGVVLVGAGQGLVLGRIVGSIVNEAVCAVEEGVASADDIDVAMQLGTNYPKGPIAWGREIGGRRIQRILARVAASDGSAFAPHRALWVLDTDPETDDATPEPVAEADVLPG